MATLMIPWWGKICAKIVLSRFSFGYAVWQKLGLFRHGQMDSTAYAIRVFNSHIEKAGLKGAIAGKTLLELGPGDSIASAIQAKAHGARAILVDAGHFVRADTGPYIELARELARQGLEAPDLSSCSSVDDILKACDARYLTEGLASLRQIEDGSVDLFFSQAVLEHVRKNEFQETMQACRRILKNGGVGSHQIDLRDHLGGALNNLRFSEKLWESDFFTRSGFYTNRIQYGRMLEQFRLAGFEVEVTGVRRWDALPTARRSLDPVFRQMPDEELRVREFDVILR
jgi:SAM-dependent methyltransferase